jgi:hypothetical protein
MGGQFNPNFMSNLSFGGSKLVEAEVFDIYFIGQNFFKLTSKVLVYCYDFSFMLKYII